MTNILGAMSQASEEAIMEHPPLLDDLILHEDDLTEQAKHQFGYHTDILRAVELSRRSILDNELLTPVGRHLIFSRIDQMYKNSKQVLNYMAANSELLSQSLPNVGPLVICGLPRTGSTLLYNLLACDHNCRAPRFTEMLIDPVPPISHSNLVEQERRTAKARLAVQLTEQLLGRRSKLAASHPTFAIEQDQFILQQVGVLEFRVAFTCPLHQTVMENWFYDKTNKNFAYDYHETFLHMLNSFDAPSSHWLLKTSSHTLYLDTLLCRYPHAHLIMTHRRLDEVLPSFCRFIWELIGIYFDENYSTSRSILMTRALRHIDKMIECIIEFRTRSNNLHKAIFDVTYDDLIKQPIVTVRRIYDHFGFHWSHEFEVAMSAWLHDNPQGKQGRNIYSLSEYGLVREDIEARYADYTSLFLRSSVSSQPIQDTASNEPS